MRVFVLVVVPVPVRTTTLLRVWNTPHGVIVDNIGLPSSGINMTYEGLVPRIQKSMLSKDVEAMQPHIRAFVERAVTFTACPECGGTRLAEPARRSRIAGMTRFIAIMAGDRTPHRTFSIVTLPSARKHQRPARRRRA